MGSVLRFRYWVQIFIWKMAGKQSQYIAMNIMPKNHTKNHAKNHAKNRAKNCAKNHAKNHAKNLNDTQCGIPHWMTVRVFIFTTVGMRASTHRNSLLSQYLRCELVCCAG
jgi:ABC-type nickel/cobalt efflux system permease component RcnA